MSYSESNFLESNVYGLNTDSIKGHFRSSTFNNLSSSGNSNSIINNNRDKDDFATLISESSKFTDGKLDLMRNFMQK
jgi:hypothetical protein